MKVEPQQLKSFLADAGLVKEKQFDEALAKAEKTKQKVGDILVSDGLLSQEQMIKMEAYILGIPFVNLEEETIDPKILKIIPEPIARSHNIIAFRKKDQNLEVAMLDPEDLRTIEFIKKKANLKILPRLTTVDSIKNALRQYAKSLEAEFGEIIRKDAGIIKIIRESDESAGSKEVEKEELRKAAEELPVIRIVDTLIKHAILQRTSDIHIEPTEKEVIVRYRIDGILRDAMLLPKTAASGIVARIKVLSDLKLDEHRLPQDGRFKVETEEYRYSVRVSILPVFDGEKIVMRLLP
ncbi:MAG: ATPase, T2SS/T4P/T4SS family, partial [Patescibacteria group bacterium]